MAFLSKIGYLRLIFILGLPFWTSGLEGTTFVVVPLETQIRNADGVIWGKFRGTKSKKISGTIVTEATFELLAMSGVEPAEVVNKRNNFKIVYPGGTWQGITYKVMGTPEFGAGEEVVLFVRKGRHGFGLVDLGLSKYQVERRNGRNGEEIFFKNSVFSSHHRLGRVSLERLNGLLKERFEQPFIRMARDKYPYPKGRLKKLYVEKGAVIKERNPASLDSAGRTPQGQNKSYEGMVWIILMFSVLGGYFVIAKRSE